MPAEGVAALFLLVRDLARSRAFYEALLGRRPERVSPEEIRFALAGLTLTLHADLDAAGRAQWGVPTPRGPRGWGVFLTLATSDVDADAALAVSRGGRLVRGPQDAPWRARVALVEDPDGYWLELSRPEPAP